MSHLAKVFECKWKALEIPLAVSVAASLVALYLVLTALHWQHYWLAGAVLIALDMADPTNFSNEGRRVLYTFAGVLLAVLVSLLLDRLKKRGAKAAPAAS